MPSRLNLLRSRVDEIDPLLQELADKPTLTATEQRSWQELTSERDELLPELQRLERRKATSDTIKNRTFREMPGTPYLKTNRSVDVGAVQGLHAEQVRSAALDLLDDRDELPERARVHVEDLVRRDDTNMDGSALARRVLLTENPDYRSAFRRLVTEPRPLLTHEEVSAVRAFEEFQRHEARAMSEGTPSAGGYGVPVFIDPTVVLTGQDNTNPFLQISDVVPVNTNAWKGINSAGVSWSFDAEASAVSDDTPTLAQPAATVFMARGFIPYSIEVGEDYPGFQAEMSRLLSEGYNDLLMQKFTNGNGTTEPKGIVTALDANTNVEVVSTTDGAFGADDLYAVWKALPVRFRGNASWLMSTGIQNKIRGFGATFGTNYTVDLTKPGLETLFGRPVYVDDYMPDFSATTGASNRLVVGDFKNFVVAQRTGMNVELIPQLMDTTTGRPTGQRGWFAYARVGSSTKSDLAFRLLQNQ